MVGDKDFTAKDMGFRAYGDAELSNYLRTRALTGGVVVVMAGSAVFLKIKRVRSQLSVNAMTTTTRGAVHAAVCVGWITDLIPPTTPEYRLSSSLCI